VESVLKFQAPVPAPGIKFLALAPESWDLWLRLQNNLVRKTEKNIVLFVQLAWTGTQFSGSGSTI